MIRILMSLVLLSSAQMAAAAWSAEAAPNYPEIEAELQRRRDAQALELAKQRELAEQKRARALKESQMIYEENRARLAELQRDLQARTGRTDVSAEGLQKTAARLDDELEALELESAGANARREALAKSMEDMAKHAEERAVKDEAVDELKKIVDTRARAVERIKALVQGNAVSAEEVERVKADWSEARIRLLDRQRDLTNAGGESMAVWNRELVNLSVAAHEREARKDAIKVRLERIREALKQIPEMQLLEQRMKAASQGMIDSGTVKP